MTSRNCGSDKHLHFALAALSFAFYSASRLSLCHAFHTKYRQHGVGLATRRPWRTIPVYRSEHRSPLQLSSSANVNVYNNVADDETCKQLHQLALETTRRSPDGSFLFHRGKNDSSSSSSNNSRLTPIETFIDRILTSLDDDSPIVEYWSRKNYINMDAHADIDENVLKDEGVLRCPRKGHVFYMQVAAAANNNDDDDPSENVQIMGPTVVFPSRKVAWGTVTPKTVPSASFASYNSNVNLEERVVEYVVDVENYWDEEQRKQYGYNNNNDDDDDASTNDGDTTDASSSSEMDEMAIVPALNGRLLRFDGAAFHAVPKPPDRYLLTEKELTAVLEEESEEDCEEDDMYWDDDEFDHDEYDDDDDEDDDEESDNDNPNLRSVLLFNTWPEGSLGPRGVNPDQIVDAMPDGIEIDGDDDDDAASSEGVSTEEDKRWQQWQDTYGDNFEQVWCNPLEEWTAEAVDASGGASSRDVGIPLMGNPSRRGCTLNKAAMKGIVSNDAFRDDQKVTLVTLECETD